MLNKTKKSQINKIFVYILSIILIVFVGFLVIKFIVSFGNDVSNRESVKIYTELRGNFQEVYTTYGAEKVLKYRLPKNVEEICFISSSSCIDDIGNLSKSEKETLKTIFNASDNVAQFGEDGIINSQNIGHFIVSQNNGCYCVHPKNQYFKIILDNINNKVYLKGEN